MNPIRFEPLLKRIRWGGTRLGTVLGKQLGSETDYAESWEISDHGADQSIVVASPLAGSTLQELLQQHNEAVFGRHSGRDQFPLLIKFLDANDRLSVQVHPDDATARTFDPTENGKTEAWVIIDAEPGSRLYAGLKTGVTPDDLQSAIAAGTLEQCLHSFEVSAGDCVFIPAGTVHAIAEGILLAEVQQSSDLTFRLYDWGRTGADGKPRELHIEQALKCIDFELGPVNCVIPQMIEHGQELVSCEYFTICRYSEPGQVQLPDDNRFHILMGLSGEASLMAGSRVEYLKLGQTLLLPATRESSTINLSVGNIVLDVFLP
ncbi:MAG: class I mannose-6-phosphate isomerase [Planctomycetota bacterium]|nr:class I mannose-6-phosphate isomerase [Planctomycetota bacterium]